MSKINITCPDITVGQSQRVEIEGQAYLICRSAKGFHMVDALCPHQQKSLEGAPVRGEALMCIHHGARFCLASGKSLSSLTKNTLRTYSCHEQDGVLTVLLIADSDG